MTYVALQAGFGPHGTFGSPVGPLVGSDLANAHLGGPILHTSQNSFTEPKNRAYGKPVETFGKIEENMTFDLTLPLFRVTKGPKNMDPEVIPCTNLKVLLIYLWTVCYGPMVKPT